MARTGVTFFDISKAAQALREDGTEPTVDRVREQLGTGSKSTIAPLLKRWREQQGAAVDVSGLPGDLVEAVRALHERLQRGAEARIEHARAELEGVSVELRQQLSQAEAAQTQASEAAASLHVQLQAATAQNQQLSEDLEKTRLNAARMESQLNEAQARIIDLKAALEEQKRESRAAQGRFEHYQQKTAEDRQQERDEYRLAAQHHQRQIQQLLEQAGQSEARYGELQAEYRAQQQALEAERSELRSVQADSMRAQAELAASAQRLKELAGENDALSRQAQAAQSQAAGSASELAVATLQVAHLQQLLEAARKAADTAQDQVSQLRDEARLLAQEKAVLEGQLKQLQASLGR